MTTPDTPEPHNDIETADSEELRRVQTERLRETARHAYDNVPFYRERFDEDGLVPEELTLDSLESLTPTTKEDLLDRYPDGLVAVPETEVVRVHASSGTSGKPKVLSYTEDDLAVWDEVVARYYTSGELTDEDTYQVSLGYGLFTGGFGFHQGAEALGARVVPMSGGNTRRQLKMMQDLDSDAIGLVTSYAIYIAETAEEMGLDPEELPVSTVFVGGEITTEAMIHRIAERWNADVYSNYGLTEIIGPGVSAQCDAREDAMHIQEDHFYPEVIDSTTGEVLDEGEEGELVLTTLTKEAMPVFRYRTGDITSLHYGECACGRTTVRMSHVTGRADNMVTVRGTNVFSSQVETVAYDFEELSSHYRIDLRREDSLDTMEITIERDPAYDGSLEGVRERLIEALAAELQLTPDAVEIVEPKTLDRTEVGKIQRLYDHRSYD